mmetsp:Transcript_93438/g.166268  ORF Transcript_93438/g.166268 Transcript_93438/m.166268 type:complete len:512 (-) Transcript_93438:137-1672(-)|eukprot:CAMPEP_0197627582 /NCGR_PEP_ID=MMETSP1338-20131121/6159_1 /TAXON_ID=43686 ORGANISM="Pelagodinium beii, Strain RCC1491" /NCGR_SAMPLE_ID=MMETSP1338 /ASSEMBLY_ACC=CAM_ASM_000754 /LENGTH=511 /DNA_ID=CAMNT_0043198337 /DNA_START=67 /DNA_END=1602 /DNA_ORIENTATION=+
MPGSRETGLTSRWFLKVFGVVEKDYEAMRDMFKMDGQTLTLKATRQSFEVGPFEVLSAADLQDRFREVSGRETRKSPCTLGDVIPDQASGELGGLAFRNLIDSTMDLHGDPENAGAVFQVCSMFNCLLLEEPDDIPEDGVTAYAESECQGSAAAIACPAATVFRNYFVNGVGQGASGKQLDLLSGTAKFAANDREGYWSMKNGFCMPRPGHKFADLAKRIETDKIFADDLSNTVQVGVHWDTAVDFGDCSSHVCQVLCSAAPVSCSKIVKANEWAPFATCLLMGAYDATLAVAAILAAQRGERVKVYLTALGGGGLCNRRPWIMNAISRVLKAYETEPLDVYLVHFASTDKYDSLQAGRPLPSLKKQITIGEQVKKLGREIGEPITMKRSRLHPTIEADLDLGMTQVIAKAFAYFDSNGDGAIDRSEFQYVLQGLDPVLFSDRTIDRLMREADADNDGEVNYTEFVSWVSGRNTLEISRILATSTFVGADSPVGIFPDSPIKLAASKKLAG